MSGVFETLADTGGFLNADLQRGADQISGGEIIEFTQYTKFVLPLDGSVYWLRGVTVEVAGSLHYSASRHQDEAEQLGIDHVVFTTSKEVTPFNAISPTTMFIGKFDGQRFAFSRRGPLLHSAGLYHYVGDSVNAVMDTQLLDNLLDINDQTLVVSNSLPAWLAMQTYNPIWLLNRNLGQTLYPSFLSPENQQPPYGTVHIEPAQTRAMESFPLLDTTGTHTQLGMDRVRVTLWGYTNQQALDFLDLVIQYAMDTGAIGLLNMPFVRDEKRTQVEIMTIAMKKVIDFDVSYLQTRMNDVARQYITEIAATYMPQPFVAPLYGVS